MNRVTATLGLGVDIIRISRFDNMITKAGGVLTPFFNRLCKRILNETHEMPMLQHHIATHNHDSIIRYMAGSWAIKEAVYKSLDEEEQKKFTFHQWYRMKTNEKPGIGSESYSKRDEEFLVSVSHDDDVLMASVIRQRFFHI